MIVGLLLVLFYLVNLYFAVDILPVNFTNSYILIICSLVISLVVYFVKLDNRCIFNYKRCADLNTGLFLGTILNFVIFRDTLILSVMPMLTNQLNLIHSLLLLYTEISIIKDKVLNKTRNDALKKLGKPAVIYEQKVNCMYPDFAQAKKSNMNTSTVIVLLITIFGSNILTTMSSILMKGFGSCCSNFIFTILFAISITFTAIISVWVLILVVDIIVDVICPYIYNKIVDIQMFFILTEIGDDISNNRNNTADIKEEISTNLDQ